MVLTEVAGWSSEGDARGSRSQAGGGPCGNSEGVAGAAAEHGNGDVVGTGSHAGHESGVICGHHFNQVAGNDTYMRKYRHEMCTICDLCDAFTVPLVNRWKVP